MRVWPESRCIGILTSGGDAPGNERGNPRGDAQRNLQRIYRKRNHARIQRFGIQRDRIEFKSQSVSNIIQLGGTILKTARSQEFTTTVEGRKAAYDNMVAAGIDALVVIGGDGSLTGAGHLRRGIQRADRGASRHHRQRPRAAPTRRSATTRRSIRSSESVDKLRDTASSHERLFFVEVMGHTAGYLALNSAIATGSEAAIIPGDGDRGGPAGRTHQPRLPQEQELGDRHRRREPRRRAAPRRWPNV